MPRTSRKNYKVNQETYGILFEAMMDTPRTTAELADISGLTRLKVASLMKVFRKRTVVFIADWEQDRWGSDMAAKYMIGRRTDKPRRQLTLEQREANRYARRILLEREKRKQERNRF